MSEFILITDVNGNQRIINTNHIESVYTSNAGITVIHTCGNTLKIPCINKMSMSILKCKTQSIIDAFNAAIGSKSVKRIEWYLINEDCKQKESD